MIIMTILFGLMNLIIFIFSLFNIPTMPLAVTGAIADVTDFMSIPIGVIRNYVGDDFLSKILGVIIIYVLISPTMYIIVWLYNKIRGSS